MAGPDDRRERREHPVLVGLVALAGVGLVVGLLVSGAALAATQVLGLDDGGDNTSRVGSRQSMYLPTPSPTAADDSPQITLAPDGQFTPTADPAAPPPSSTTPTITLALSTTQARPGEEITLSGTYPAGQEGSSLAVERNVDGTWTSFVGVTATVRGGTFSTYIRTSQPGDSTFRVRDTSTDLASNEVTFTIG